MHFPFQNAREREVAVCIQVPNVDYIKRNGGLHHGIRAYMAMCQERQSPSQSCLPPIHHSAAKAARALHISETDNILASHVSLRDPFDALKTKGQLISLRFGAFETPTKSKCRRLCQPQDALPGSQSRPPAPR